MIRNKISAERFYNRFGAKMTKSKYFFSVFYVAALIAFAGCSSSIKIQAAKNSQIFSIDVDLGKTLSDTIREVSAGMAQMNSSSRTEIQIFETQKIKSSLESAGFSSVKVESPSAEKLRIRCSGRLENFVEQGADSLTVKVNPANVQKIVSLLGEETKSFFDLLMAPILTGEKMTPAEYTDLVAVVYGENLADELKKSALELKLVSLSGKTKNFSIPLADFLSLTDEKIFSAD